MQSGPFVRWIRSHGAVLGVSLATVVTIAVLAIFAERMHPGRFAYSLDDAYIHMAIAKNLAGDGVWGITRYEFVSAASSLSWPLLLAGLYRVFGPFETAPFLMNVLCAALVPVMAGAMLRTRGPKAKFVALAGIVVLIPVIPIVFQGMEHTLHVVLTLAFVWRSAGALARLPAAARGADASLASPGPPAATVALAFLLTATRFEAGFTVLVVAALALLRGRIVFAAILAVAGGLPILGHAFYSIPHGGSWLPNSVLLKGNAPDAGSPIAFAAGLARHLHGIVTERYDRVIPLLGTFFVAAFAFVRRFGERGPWERGQLVAIVFLANTVLHGLFASIALRYVAYLVALGLVVAARFVLETLESRDVPRGPRREALAPVVVASVAVAVALGPVLAKNSYLTIAVPRHTTNIHDQQVQMGLFLAEFYEGRVVAANDVGAINYFADIRCVDLVGLGTTDVMKVLRASSSEDERNARLRELLRERRAEIAVLYPDWFPGLLPESWRKVGEWTIANNSAAARETVAFFAVDPARAKELAGNLRAFASRLPRTVRVSGDPATTK